MHPFKDGQLNDVPNSNPLGDDRCAGLTNTNPDSIALDHNFRIEVHLNHKAASGYSTPGAACDREYYTSVGPSGYRLKYFLASDINMGDSSRYADVIIPDTSYLERYVGNWHENGATKICMGMRQPVWQSADGENTHLHRDLVTGYGTRPIRQTIYQWARAIESDSLDVNGDALTRDVQTGWNGDLIDSYSWNDSGALDTFANSVDANRADRAWASAVYSVSGLKAGMIPAQTNNPSGATGSNEFDYMRANGVWESPEGYTPNYWRDGQLLEVYDAVLDAALDPTIGDGTAGNPIESAVKIAHGGADYSFYGSAVYVPPNKCGGRPSDGDQSLANNGVYNMTTYKVNVHTQSRTAALPRLAEIIGQNWAVFAPGSVDKNGAPIANGDKVKLSAVHKSLDGTLDTSIARHGIWEAKVTVKATNPDVVSISQSFGHDVASFGGDGAGSQGWEEFNPITNTTDYNVNGAAGIGAPNYVGNPTAPSTTYDPNTRTNEPAMGLNAGANGAWIMTRGGEDPIGGSVAWFDTIVEVEKV